jgi:hypothetical protein
MNQRNRPNLAAENEAGSTRRAALYLRVLTGRQAEHALSIPDQRTQLQSWQLLKYHAWRPIAKKGLPKLSGDWLGLDCRHAGH